MLWVRIAALVAGLILGSSAGVDRLAPLVARWSPESVRIEQLVVLGADRLPVMEVAASAGLAPGATLDRIDRKALAERIETHPWIATARVAGRLGSGQLVIAVMERDPQAIAELVHAGDAGSHPWWVDAAGVPFARVDASDSPMRETGTAALVIEGVSDAEPGRADPRIAQAVRIASSLRTGGLPAPRAIRVDGPDPRILPLLQLEHRPAQVLLGGGDLDVKLVRLQELLTSGLAEVDQASVIDLRFGDRTVLRGGPSPHGDEAAVSRGSTTPLQPEPRG